MIDGVKVKPLAKICDERGMIMHMLRCDDPDFEKFGEIYSSPCLEWFQGNRHKTSHRG